MKEGWYVLIHEKMYIGRVTGTWGFYIFYYKDNEWYEDSRCEEIDLCTGFARALRVLNKVEL